MEISIIDHELPDETHNTYDVHFFGNIILTTVTHDHYTVSEWISEIEYIHRRRLHRLIVGLDVEWRPSYSRNFHNPIATLQLCVGRRCLIFQLIYARFVPNSLVRFLANPNYTFVGVGIDSDVVKIQQDYDFGYHTNTVDLRSEAAECYDRMEMRNWGPKRLAEMVLEIEVEKPRWVTMSRWDNEFLDVDQVQYACVDAFMSFEIGMIFISNNSS